MCDACNLNHFYVQKCVKRFSRNLSHRLIKYSIRVSTNLITFPHDQFAFMRLHNVTKGSQVSVPRGRPLFAFMRTRTYIPPS